MIENGSRIGYEYYDILTNYDRHKVDSIIDRIIKYTQDGGNIHKLKKYKLKH